jgi:hypothetical protein
MEENISSCAVGIFGIYKRIYCGKEVVSLYPFLYCKV